MTIEHNSIEIASAGVEAYKRYRNFKKYLFVSLSLLFFIAAIIFFFLEFIVWGILFIVLTLVAFGISRFFVFTSKILDRGLKTLQQYKQGELSAGKIQNP